MPKLLDLPDDTEVTSVRLVPLESNIEAKVRQWAKKNGWWVAKFVAPGRNGVPDRIFIRKGFVVFIELKRPGKEPTEQQYKVHEEMRRHGAYVHWANTYEDAIAILAGYHL